MSSDLITLDLGPHEPLAPTAPHIRVHKARLQDARNIFDLVNSLSHDGTLLRRSYAEICENIRDFTVAYRTIPNPDTGEPEDEFLGCGALHLYGPHLAEVRSIVVREDRRGLGAGDAILEALIAEADEHEVASVCLFTRIPDYFEHLGFRIAERDAMPDKIYKDCQTCPRLYACDEVAMVRGPLPNIAVLGPRETPTPRTRPDQPTRPHRHLTLSPHVDTLDVRTSAPCISRLRARRQSSTSPTGRAKNTSSSSIPSKSPTTASASRSTAPLPTASSRPADISFFLYCLYQTLVASQQIEAFRLASKHDEVFLYNRIDRGSVIDRSDGTFGYGFFPTSKNLDDVPRRRPTTRSRASATPPAFPARQPTTSSATPSFPGSTSRRSRTPAPSRDPTAARASPSAR